MDSAFQETPQWRHEVIAGGDLSSSPVVFSRDSKYFFCCVGRNIEMYSLATGLGVRTLRGHFDVVTAAMLNPKNALQLYSVSLDGTLRLWDFNDEELLDTWNLRKPLINLFLSDSAIHVVSQPQPRAEEGDDSDGKHEPSSIFTVNFDTSTSEKRKKGKRSKQSESEAVLEPAMNYSGSYVDSALSPSGRYLAVAAGKTIVIQEIDSGERRVFTHTTPFKCIAFHPSEEYIAAGDEVGVITLWYFITDEQQDHQDMTKRGSSQATSTSSVLHWHSHGVQCLSFTDDGAHMLSGGDESVLVIWQLSTGSKQFLPRIGGSLRHICVSPDSTLYALSLGNNCVRLISALSLRQTQGIHGLKWISETSPLLKLKEKNVADLVVARAPMILNPQKSLLTLGGLANTLQVFDLSEKRHVSELEVAARPGVSKSEFEKPLISPCVIHAAVSHDRQWMATVDMVILGAKDKVNTSYRLQFWQLKNGSVGDDYIVNTRVDTPHEGAVLGLVFHPTLPIVLTCGQDGYFRSWVVEATDKKESPSASAKLAESDVEGRVQWVCQGAGMWAEEPAQAICFSPDGSLLAVAYDESVTLWDPSTNELVKTLSEHLSPEPIRHLAFVPGSTLLVSASASRLVVWDVSSSSVRWAINMPIVMINVSSSMIAVALGVRGAESPTPKSKWFMLLMDPLSSKPLGSWEVDHRIDGMVFSGRDTLFYLTQKRLYSATACTGDGDEGEGEDEEEEEEEDKMTLDDDSGYFDAVFGKHSQKKSAQRKGKMGEKTKTTSKGLPSVFAMPSHVLPDSQALLREFMSIALAKAPSSSVSSGGIKDNKEADTDTISILAAPAPALTNTPAEIEKEVEMVEGEDEQIQATFVDFFSNSNSKR